MKPLSMETIGKTIYLTCLLAGASALSVVFIYGGKLFQKNSTPSVAANHSENQQDKVAKQKSEYHSSLIHPFEKTISHSDLTLDSLQTYPQVTLVGNFSANSGSYARSDARHWSQKVDIDRQYYGGYENNGYDVYWDQVDRQQGAGFRPSGRSQYSVAPAGFSSPARGSQYQNSYGSSSPSSGGYPNQNAQLPYRPHSYDMTSRGGYGCDSGYGGGYGNGKYGGPVEYRCAVDDSIRAGGNGNKWRSARPRPWDRFAYGEYIGPYRTPHTYGDYIIRVNDELRFTFLRTHAPVSTYRLAVGDEIEVAQVTADVDTLLFPTTKEIIPPDGHIYLQRLGKIRAEGLSIEQLRKEIVNKYREAQAENEDGEKLSIELTVRPLNVGVRLQELIRTVDSTAGQGGTFVTQRVHPDGQIRLQGIPQGVKINAIGLTLDELEAEVNAQYAAVIPGVNVKVVLENRATRSVYVLGEVGEAGQIEINAPTTLIQAIARAQNFNQGADLKNIVVFRRDQNWRLIATKVDLSKALFHGNDPSPDDIWLRDSDIIVVPKTKIQRISELVDLYFTRTFYAIIPNQGFSFNFDNNSIL